LNVRYRVSSGKHLLAASISGLDPEQTFARRIFLFSRDCLGKNCGCLTSSREIIHCGPHFLEARAVVAIETREPRKGY
jgi:hypothetical protein